jgi:hypothetical protein
LAAALHDSTDSCAFPPCRMRFALPSAPVRLVASAAAAAGEVTAIKLRVFFQQISVHVAQRAVCCPYDPLSVEAMRARGLLGKCVSLQMATRAWPPRKPKWSNQRLLQVIPGTGKSTLSSCRVTSVYGTTQLKGSSCAADKSPSSSHDQCIRQAQHFLRGGLFRARAHPLS